MSDSPVSRGKFLRSLGSSVTSMAMNSGIVAAAQTLASRIASPDPDAASVPPATEPDIPFIESGPTDGDLFALTFDDGPTPGVTDLILDELKKRHLYATFFMIGQRVVEAPELARRVKAEGHEIGNHTFTHPKLNTLPESQVVEELQKTQDVFSELLDHRAVWFRPPYLAFRKNQAAIPQRAGLGIITGNVDSVDWSQPGEAKIIEAILSKTQPGSIIICHDIYKQTANCVGEILDRLLERNLNCVTLSSLLGPTSR